MGSIEKALIAFLRVVGPLQLRQKPDLQLPQRLVLDRGYAGQTNGNGVAWIDPFKTEAKASVYFCCFGGNIFVVDCDPDVPCVGDVFKREDKAALFGQNAQISLRGRNRKADRIGVFFDGKDRLCKSAVL